MRDICKGSQGGASLDAIGRADAPVAHPHGVVAGGKVPPALAAAADNSKVWTLTITAIVRCVDDLNQNEVDRLTAGKCREIPSSGFLRLATYLRAACLFSSLCGSTKEDQCGSGSFGVALGGQRQSTL